jgi:hypothetical protein
MQLDEGIADTFVSSLREVVACFDRFPGLSCLEQSHVPQAYKSIGDTIVQLRGQCCSGLIATVS